MPGNESDTPELDINALAADMGLTLVNAPGNKSEQTGNGRDSKALSEDAEQSAGMHGELLDEEEQDEDDSDTDEQDAEDADDESGEGDAPDSEEGDEEDGDDSEGDDEEEGEDREEENEDQPPAIRKLRKRIDKLTARISERDRRIEELEEQARNAQQIVLQPTPENPLSQVNSLAELDRLVAAAQRQEQWAEDNPDGAEVPLENGETRYFTAAEMKAKLQQARMVLRAAPARREYLAQRPAVEEEVRLFYPELLKPGTTENKILKAVFEQVPSLRNLPNAEVMIGDMLAGQALRQKRWEALQAKAKAKGKPAPKESKAKGVDDSDAPLPKAPKVTSRGEKRSVSDARKASAVKRVAQGDRSDAAILSFIENVVLPD